MKKNLFCMFIMIFLTFCIFCEEIKIMSFNLRGNDSNNRKENSEWVQAICNIIIDSKADIVLFQEVCIDLEKRLDTNIFKISQPNNLLDVFVNYLGSQEWGYFSTAEYGIRTRVTRNGQQYGYGDKTQNNAILYNKEKLNAKDWAEMLGFETFSGEFLFEKNTVQIIEFSLVEKDSVVAKNNSSVLIGNVHLPYGNKEARYRDLQTLEKLYAKYKHNYGVIIGGDFNLRRSELINRNFDFVDGTNSWYFDRHFGLATTLKNDENAFVFSNDYDHFIYNEKIIATTKMERAFIQGRNNSYETVTIGGISYTDAADYREKISDHIPVIIVIEM